MKTIQFLGAAGGVTGSGYFLTDKVDYAVLIDFGMFQGTKTDELLNAEELLFNPDKLQAVFLTHAHLDHCGRLPLLVKAGFRGNIYTTEATKAITHISLTDAAELGKEKNEQKPLYTADDVEQTYRQMHVVSYDQQFSVGGFQVTFRNAGHILGSASIEITDTSQTVVFSGDIGNSPETLIQPIEYIHHADTVIMESTYGDRIHPKEDVLAVLQKEIHTISSTGGILLIPAFSIERTQEILFALHQLLDKKLISPDIPIFLDSPMAIEVTEIFKKFPQLYSSMLAREKHPFVYENLVATASVEESKAIEKAYNPKIVIAGSGMMTGGRILHHFSNYISLPTTRILIVGYQAVETLGREILEGAKHISLYGKDMQVQATVTKLETLSSHADQPKLLDWLEHIKGVKKVFLTHGEDTARGELSEKIQKKLDIRDVILPVKGEIHEVS